MFFKLQFADIQAAQERQLVNEQAELQKYAEKENANDKAIEIRQEKLISRANYLNFMTQLVNELETEITRARSAGYRDGWNAYHETNFPNPVQGTIEQRRATNILNAQLTWPELY